MGEIHKDITSRIATFCKCRELAPRTLDMIDFQKTCSEYKSRPGGWCRHYRGGSQMCTYQDPPDGKDVVKAFLDAANKQ